MRKKTSVKRHFCKECDDGDGICVYPLYGLAPHIHRRDREGQIIIGGTIIDAPETWPSNFDEDKEAPGCGVYTHCLNCGAASFDWVSVV